MNGDEYGLDILCQPGRVDPRPPNWRSLEWHKWPRRPRGAWKAYCAEHYPALTAFLDGDMERFHELRAQHRAREEAFNEREVYCLTCHALMLHATCGIFYCPYERAGVHQKARRALSGENPHRR